MDKELKNSEMEICMLGVMLMESHQDMVSIIGQMEVSLKVALKMDWGMEMEFGKEIQVNQINIKEVMQMIKNVVMEFLLGQAEMYIKATILMM